MNGARIQSVESFVVELPRDVPYLGPLGPGEEVNAKGYVVRRKNRTIYPTTDRSVIVKVTASDGTYHDQQTFQWAISAAGPVVVTALSSQSNLEGDAVSLQVQASNSNNSTLIYSATNLPTGLSIDPATGLISGTISPGMATATARLVAIVASDGDAHDSS